VGNCQKNIAQGVQVGDFSPRKIAHVNDISLPPAWTQWLISGGFDHWEGLMGGVFLTTNG